jgi:hypothetical protein
LLLETKITEKGKMPQKLNQKKKKKNLSYFPQSFGCPTNPFHHFFFNLM